MATANQIRSIETGSGIRWDAWLEHLEQYREKQWWKAFLGEVADARP